MTIKCVEDQAQVALRDVSSFRERGFVVLRKIFTREFIELVRECVTPQLVAPTDRYQRGFDCLAYDTCTGNEGIYVLLADLRFRAVMRQLTAYNLFFTQGVGFGVRAQAGSGLSWHIEAQSFGFQRAEDYGVTLWIPLDPIDTKGQRGGLRYVSRATFCGQHLYSHVAPAVFKCVEDRIRNGGISFEEYLALRDGPLNSPAMSELLEHYAQEDDFELGDAVLMDKFVVHRSVALDQGPLSMRRAFALRFICETSRYDKTRAMSLEVPRVYFGYEGPTRFHLDVCRFDGERIMDSRLFDEDRSRRMLNPTRSAGVHSARFTARTVADADERLRA